MLGERIQELIGQELEDTSDPPREMSADEVVDFAISLQRSGELETANLVYHEVLKRESNHPRALHYAGILGHQEGKSDEGVAMIEKSLALVPDLADWHSNFGIVLQECGRFDEAIAAYHRAIALDGGHANAYSNLGVLLRATGKPVEAEEAYRTAIRLNPSHIDAYTNLGILLNGLKRTDEAVACYCRVITLKPKHKEARRLLALAHCTLGEYDRAIEIFEEWLRDEPDDPIARHMLAACTGRDVPARASNGFVTRTFDSFAASFESKLAKLSYRAPTLVAAMLEDAGIAPAQALNVLDAGCGTGLCGPLVRPYAARLTGVDLSAGMLKQAVEKNVYDDIFEGELTAFLRSNTNTFDVIVSADTLVYFGALEDVVDAAARALRDEGLLIFTVERAVDESAPDYRLEAHGRYTHAQPYVEGLLKAVGLSSEIAHADLRMESGVPVSGLVVRAKKGA